MKRDTTVDFLKGVAILLVVIGHFNPVQQVGDFIYSFHMPLFFFLSGVTFWYSFGVKLSKENYKKIIPQTLGKRVCSLCLPYVSWSAIRFFACGNSIAETFNQLWFLPTLFGIITVFVFVELTELFIAGDGSNFKKVCTEIFSIAVLCGFILLLMKFSGIKLFRQIIIYALPFYIGFSVKKYEFIQKIINNQFILTLCLLAFAILVPFYSQNDKSVMVLLIRFVIGICFTVVLYYTSRIYIQESVNQRAFCIFEFLGKHTLKIYIIHFFFCPFFAYDMILNPFWDTVFKIMGAIIISLLCILIAHILSQSNILKLILFGEEKIKNVNNKLSEVITL